MKRDGNHIDTMFSDAAGNFSAEVPDRVWGKVASGLDSMARMRRVVWYRWSAAAAAAVFAFLIGYYFPGRNERIVYVNNGSGPISKVIPIVMDGDDGARPVSDNHSATEYHETASIREAGGDRTPVQVHGIRDGSGTDIMETGSSGMVARIAEVSPRSVMLPEFPGEALYSEIMQEPVTPRLLSLAEATPFEPVSAGQPVNTLTWKVGGSGSPAYAYRNLENTPTDQSALADNTTEQVEKKDAPIVSYAAAVTTTLDIGNRFSVHSGLQFSRMGQSTQEPLLQYRMGSNSRAFTSAGMVIFNEYANEEIQSMNFMASGSHYNGSLLQQYDYLEVPLIASYRVVDASVDVSVFAGMSAGFLVGNNAWFVDESGTRILAGYTYELNKRIYGGVAGLGIEYPIIGRLSMNVFPGFKYSFSPVNDYSSVGNHPYSFMLNTGLNFRLIGD